MNYIRKLSTIWAICILGLAAIGCVDEEAPATQNQVTNSDAHPLPNHAWKKVVPSAGMPEAATSYASNNNLDVILFKEQLYLVFRTAPSHFAGPDTLIHIVRADDPRNHENWELEATFFTGKDLREPRFFVHDDQLYMYVTELGNDASSFEPGRTIGTVRNADGTWTEPKLVFDDGRIVWRIKTRNNKIYMTTYRGGEAIYQDWSPDIDLELMFLTTTDGWNWIPVEGDEPVVVTGGISETAFEFDAEGNLYATLRNEAGDETGFGSRFCTAPAEDIMNWTCTQKSDPHKYDSPYMFRYDEWIYLIGRWSPKPFDLNPDQPISEQRFWDNQIEYSTSPKKTALYGYHTTGPSVSRLDFFPSTGDTSFAAGVWISDTEHLVFNYSSDFTLGEFTWIEGQKEEGGSQIYSAILTFE